MTVIPLNCLDTSCLGVVERTQIWPGAIDLWPDYNSRILMASLPKQPNYLEMMVMPDSMSVTEQAIDVEWNPSSLRDTPLGPFFLLNFSRKRLRIELNSSCCAFSVRTISVIITEKRRSRYLSEMLNIFLKRKIDDEGRYTTDVWTENFELTCENERKYANASLHALSNYVFSLQEYGKAEELIPSDAGSVIGRLLGGQRDPNIIPETDTSFDEIWTSCCEATPSRTTLLPVEWQVARAIWMLEAVSDILGLILEGADPGRIYFPISLDRTWLMIEWGSDLSELNVHVFTKRRIDCNFSTFYEDVYDNEEALKVITCLGIEFIPEEDENDTEPNLGPEPPPNSGITVLEDGSWRLPPGSMFGFISKSIPANPYDKSAQEVFDARSWSSFRIRYSEADVTTDQIEITSGPASYLELNDDFTAMYCRSRLANAHSAQNVVSNGKVRGFLNNALGQTEKVVCEYGNYKTARRTSSTASGSGSEQSIVIRLPGNKLYFMSDYWNTEEITWPN